VATMPATVAVAVSKPVRIAVFIGQVNQDQFRTVRFTPNYG
jgi:hypothetical protein